MADLEGYSPRGAIHIIINNQLGFTTMPRDGRSTFHCTDIGKIVDAPIFHVNGDEPDLVEKVFKIALEYRMMFKKDVVIDIVGYRRYGHNELD